MIADASGCDVYAWKKCVQVEDGVITIDKVSSGEEPVATWYMKSGSEGGARFEAYSKPGYNLGDLSGVGTLLYHDGSEAVSAQTTFNINKAVKPEETDDATSSYVIGNTYGIRSRGDEDLYWR